MRFGIGESVPFLLLGLFALAACSGSDGDGGSQADALDAVLVLDSLRKDEVTVDLEIRAEVPNDALEQDAVDEALDETLEIVKPSFPLLPLRTQGRYVVDGEGRRVRLMGVNWNGAHEEKQVPHGLGFHSPDVIAARLVELGFNSVRLTWSNEMVETNPLPNPDDVAGWPEAAGMNCLEVFDGVVEALTDAGLLVILNNHISNSIWCCNDDDGNGLWYTNDYPEAAWIADWVALAQRYQDNPRVIGGDLRNEPRQGADWGIDIDPAVDWPSAAGRCGEAVLAVRPDWLIFVEGTNYAVNLEGLKQRQIQLSVPNRVVYSMHNYSWSITSLMPGEEFYRQMAHDTWGYALEPPYEVPLWLGEFGTCNDCWNSDWAGYVTRAIQDYDLDWSLWLIFGGGGGGWGLMSEETLEVHSPELLGLLEEWGLSPQMR